MTMTPPGRVLDAHTAAYEAMKHPAPGVSHSVTEFISQGWEAFAKLSPAGFAATPGLDKPTMERAWRAMVAPARNGGEFLQILASNLYQADTFHITPEMTAAVSATYEETADRIGYIEDRDLFGPAGFAYFEEPLVLTDAGGNTISNRAISWCHQNLVADGEPYPGVRISSWADPGEPGGLLQGMREVPGGLSLVSSTFVPYGQRFMPRDMWGAMPEKLGAPPGTKPDSLDRWVYTLWLFMDTEFAVEERPLVERHARKRGLRSLNQTEVRVILLRRSSHHTHGSGDHEPLAIEWSHRWVVRGHDRHLGDYLTLGHKVHQAEPEGQFKICRICKLGTTHVRAYIKGPDGLPLKAGRTLYRLAR